MVQFPVRGMPRRSRGDVIVLALAAALAAAPTVVQTAELDLSPIKQASADAVMSRSLVMSADAVMSRSLVMNPLSRAEVMPASAHDRLARSTYALLAAARCEKGPGVQDQGCTRGAVRQLCQGP